MPDTSRLAVSRCRAAAASVLGAAVLGAALGGIVLPRPAAATVADEPQILLEVEPERIGVLDTLVVSVSLSGTVTRLDEPRLEVGSSFRTAGKSTSQSISFVNGRTAVQMRYRYTLQPLREGIFDIGPAVATHGGKEIRSNTARVQVVAGSVAPREPAPGRNPWAPLLGERRERPAPRAEVRVLAELDRSEAFVGEQVTYTLRLLTQQSVQSVKPRNEPQLTGLWVEPLEVPNPPQAVRTVVDGQPYTTFLLKKTALFPTSPGTVRIAESVWDVSVVASDFLFAEATSVARSTDLLELRVLPLPETGKASGFGGAVGDFTLAVGLDKGEVKVNDALALKVTVTGSGNLKALPAPELPPLNDFKLYNSTSTQSPQTRGGRVGGSRTWEYVLVAKAPGDHVLPPLSYPIFDPARREYRVLRSDPIAVKVGKSDGGPEAVAVGSGPEPAGERRTVEPVRKDVAYLKLAAPGLGEPRQPLYRRRAWQLSLLLPLVLDGAALLVLWGRRQRLTDSGQARRQRALREARRKLKLARAASDGKRPGEAPGLVSEALLGYIGDRFNLPPQGLTLERVEELLGGVVERARVAELKRLLERVDFLRFTRAAAEPQEIRSLVEEAGSRLAVLDRALSRSRAGAEPSRAPAEEGR